MVQPASADTTNKIEQFMKMKLIFCIIMCSSAAILANEHDALSSLLKETIQQLPERARSTESIVERRSTSFSRIESFSKIEILITTSWERDLPEISEFAESESEKAIYFKAAQKLSRRDYLRFMTAAASLVANGSISKQHFKWGIFPEEKHLREMWIENPANGPLKNLAHQASLIFSDDKNMKDFFEKVVSGQLAIDSIGKGEKSLGATPLASQKPFDPNVPKSTDQDRMDHKRPTKKVEQELVSLQSWLCPGFIVLLLIMSMAWLRLRKSKLVS